MTLYTFDPRQMIRQIVVVGLGGTGSHVARNLARLLYHRRENRQSVPEMLFVDPDIVESSNLGRQLFAPTDLNQSKAVALARRYNCTFGLNIAALCAPLDTRKHIQAGAIVCGCVDNHDARREIARAQNCIWIDAGNEYDHGQVVIGNAGEWDAVWAGLAQARDNVCSVLPHAGLLFPALLEPVPDKVEPELSCAELATRGDQHLYINNFMGNLVTQYVYQLLNREPITTFVTFATLTPCVSIRGTSFTRENLNVYHATGDFQN